MGEYQGIFGDEFNAGIFGYAIVIDENTFGEPAPMTGVPGAAGLGLDVPTSLGTKTFDVNAKNWCGSQAAIQQMLTDLGYYRDIIDGKITLGGPTWKAMVNFAKESGVSVGNGITPAFCQSLQDAWTAKMAPPEKDKPITRPAASRKMSYASLFAPREGGAQGGGGAVTTSETPSWWSQQSTGTKVAVVGGGALVLGLVGYGISKAM